MDKHTPAKRPSCGPSRVKLCHSPRGSLRAYAPKTIAETFDWDPAEVLGRNARLVNLAGVGAAIWAETIKDFTDLTFMLLPRLAGIAEKGWDWNCQPSGIPSGIGTGV